MVKGFVIAFVLILILSFPMAACAEQAEPAYTIVKVDGDIDWDEIPALAIDHVLWTEDYGIRAGGQLCFDDENLYVRLCAAEKEIRAENTEPLSPVWEDSCLEFFFMPDGGDNYFNFEINPNGCLCNQIGPDRKDRVNLVRNDCQEYFDIQTGRTEDGCEVSYRIPLKFIRLFYPDYRFEGDLLANLYKCGDGTAQPHYLSWAPIDLPSPNFHCPEYFARMHFAD